MLDYYKVFLPAKEEHLYILHTSKLQLITSLTGFISCFTQFVSLFTGYSFFFRQVPGTFYF